jgi:hypothetical protein
MNFQTTQDETQPNEVEEPGEVSTDADASGPNEKKPQVSRETLGLIGVLLACGGVVAFMYLRNGPLSAGAATLGGNAATVDQFLGNSDEHVKMMQKALQHTDAVVQEFRSYPSRHQVPLSELSTNPFRESAAKSGVVETESEGAAKRRREQERADVTKSAQSLQLQSVLHGPRNACLINNTLVEQGEQIEGFTVEQIGIESVVVCKGNYRFEVRMR